MTIGTRSVLLCPNCRIGSSTSGRALMVSVALLTAAGCGAADQFGGTLIEQHVSIDEFLDSEGTTIGLGGEHDSLLWFASISDAAFLGDQHIAVLDRSPPYLRIFDVKGNLVATHLPKGKGPGEAESPTSLATNDHLEMLVLHDGRLSRFSLEDGYLATHLVEGVSPRDIGRGCSGWLLYGPEGNWLDGEDKFWAHRIIVSGQELTFETAGLMDSGRPARLSRGSGLIGGGVGGWIRHDVGPRRLRPACADTSVPQISERKLQDAHRLMERPADDARRQDDVEQFSVSTSALTLRSFVLSESEVLLSMGTMSLDAGFESLLIQLTDDGPRIGVSHRTIGVRDISPGGTLLLTISQPIPHLVLVPAAEMLALLGG